jgi:hypothetical protein
MRWKTYWNPITTYVRVQGDDAKPLSRGFGWSLIRVLTASFGWDDAVLVKVDETIAAAGYRLGIRQEGSEAQVSDRLMYHRRLAVIIGPRSWLIFLLDKDGNQVPCEVSPRGKKADPEYAKVPLFC